MHFKSIQFSCLFLVLSATSLQAQTSKAPMGGTWYCSNTKEIFAIETDDNNSIQGRGVWYSKGGTAHTQLQIMSQTATTDGYLLKCYDLAKPNMVYHLTSSETGHGTQIQMTRTGSRSKINYFENLHGTVPATKGLAKVKGWESIRKSLIEKTWTDSKRPKSPLTFSMENGAAMAMQDEASARFKVNDNTHEITVKLSTYGDVTMNLRYDEEWYLEVRDKSGAVVALLSGE